MFKQRILLERHKFDSTKHKIVSFDAKSLYTNINVPRVINHILDIIYANGLTSAADYFEEYDADNVRLPPPDRKTFENFALDTLLKFSSFETVNGTYRQSSGLAMGSKVSPILANLFVAMMEQTVIEKHIELGDIVCYYRYVDDVFACLVIDKEEAILNNMNSFDPLLEFTTEQMESNTLNFLDTTAYVDEHNVIQLKHYRKLSKSKVTLNFHESITPKSQKISALVGHIYRCHYATTTERDFETALVEMKKVEMLNGYPEKLIDSKIIETKRKNFQPSDRSSKRREEIQTFPERNHRLCIAYTSHNCHNISRKIISCIKNVTPQFNVDICFSNVKLSRYYTPRLKCSIPMLEKSGVVYKFLCPCSKSYIGETKRVVRIRISEHYKIQTNQNPNDPKNRKKTVYQHINSCPVFQLKLSEYITDNSTGVSPTPDPCDLKLII